MPNLQKDPRYEDGYYEEEPKHKRFRIIAILIVGILAILFVISFLSLGDKVTYETKVEKKTIYPLISEPETPYYIKRVNKRIEDDTRYLLVGTTITPVDGNRIETYVEYYEFSFDEPKMNSKQNRVGIRANKLDIAPTDKDEPYIEVKTVTPKVINPKFPDIFGMRDTRERYTYTMYVPYKELDK